eukprot:CAMPEP_0174349550 /NCGR_PEP_ID=MMETSP0811_2-20130205/6302_1 /TAXON_ID=73025 ORGANISM="Eutreptiella gymnastica-like, Strain CCMP1594" /NCGR_SAMPLE_ID=MMETSP0811_2 /ASSEMBLY_ACC=CAM_ASM_000667 /LENGTH=58 /DNA_ID=CAMNT_0015477009 /DNA_START=184 /DNA_END=356 /DNA_ORIENTATION=-
MSKTRLLFEQPCHGVLRTALQDGPARRIPAAIASRRSYGGPREGGGFHPHRTGTGPTP